MWFRYLIVFVFLSVVAGNPILLLPKQTSGVSREEAQAVIDVQLRSLTNSTVKVLITNITKEKLRIIRRGGLLDDKLPTKKVVVSRIGANPVFTGAEVTYTKAHLSPEAFMNLAPNQTAELIFDAADSYDLLPRAEYSAIADGMLEYTRFGDNKTFLSAPYRSNVIKIAASKDPGNYLATRATLTTCTDEHTRLMQANLHRTAEMARAAAADARNGNSGLFQKFFMSQSQADRQEVAHRLEAIAKEATTQGTLTYYCEASENDSCGGNIAAITYPTENRVVNCPGYYESQQTSNQCDYVDQAGISLHEFSHATSVYAPGTDDIAYGLQGVLQLNTQQAKRNADSFAYYANAVFNNCGTESMQQGTQNGGHNMGLGGGENGEVTITPGEQRFGQENPKGDAQGANHGLGQ